MLYPHTRYMRDAIEKRATFFVKISDVFFERTKPDSNIAKPGAINITSTPHNKNTVRKNHEMATGPLSKTDDFIKMINSLSKTNDFIKNVVFI